MQTTRRRELFTTIHTEGAMLPADLLGRIADNDRDIEGLRAEDYGRYGERLNEAISRSWNRLLGVWTAFQDRLSKLPEDDPATGLTRERWLLPLFEELGYGRLTTTRAIEIEGKSYPVSHLWRASPIHLVGYNVELERRTRGVAGAATMSPHGLVQEFLNRSDDHLWGFVSNGKLLRVLRDNVSLTRQAYVDFDLEAMMNGDIYADFVVLWLLCHETRVEPGMNGHLAIETGDDSALSTAEEQMESVEDCWLEQWSKLAAETGTRFREDLRNGVQEAINQLGAGFLAHPANDGLRQKLRNGELSRDEYYRQTLRIVYRLLFLFVAEDRGLLLDPMATSEAVERYRRYYSTRRLRELAGKLRGTRHADLWEGLNVVFTALDDPEGCPPLGLPALGSFLWSDEATPDLAGCKIENSALLRAIFELAYVSDSNVRRNVDYKNLGSQELGSVYESLLELEPEINIEPPRFELKSVGGSERKTTGSYYTPDSLVNGLLDTALDPVLDEAARSDDPETAILDLNVCDPAAGSGHFLIAAAHRIARRLAVVRSGDDEPPPSEVQHALRDVISRCIYGVDINPMAVELCKVSLWMEALEPGTALSFLDHHIKTGNSLLGATPRLLDEGIPNDAFKPIEGDDKAYVRDWKKRNREELKGQRALPLGAEIPWDQIGQWVATLSDLAELDDGSIEGEQTKQELYEEAITSNGYRDNQFLADTWCAAFVWKKTEEWSEPIHEALYRQIERNPNTIHSDWEREIQRLADQYRFFHWHLAFPEVFQQPTVNEAPESPVTGWSGGFDIVLGNPPWEQIQLDPREFFTTSAPYIANARNMTERNKLIRHLRNVDPSLYNDYSEARRYNDGVKQFAHSSGRFPLCGVGRANTYALFAELNRFLISQDGRAGFIIQSNIATNNTFRNFFSDLLDANQLVSFYDFVNTEGLFPHIDRRHPHFCLITLSGSATGRVTDFAFWNSNTGHLQETQRHFELGVSDFRLLNPNTGTCPIFRTRRDAELTKSIYRRVPVLIEDGPPEHNPWNINFMLMFMMNTDSDKFRTRDEMEQTGYSRHGNIYTEGVNKYLPLYEGKLLWHFDHRWATYVDGNKTRDIGLAEKLDPTSISVPRYWISNTDVERRLGDRWVRDWLLGWRDITNTSNERTVVAQVIPRVGVGNKFPLMFSNVPNAKSHAALQANLSSFTFDYVARQKIGGTTLNFYIYKQLPVLPPESYSVEAGWYKNTNCLDWISSRVVELTYTAWDIESFAHDCGFNVPPFKWDEERRFLLRCELDAAYFHLYGIERNDVGYIMNTFPIVRRKDEAAHGCYRTRDTILQIYDAMVDATLTGIPYQTLLDPPPADLSLTHDSGTRPDWLN